jgi:hypothetical protein
MRNTQNNIVTIHTLYFKRGGYHMLEQRDLEMLKGVMESVVHESGNKIIVEMDTRFRESENMILEELDRVQINLEKRIDKVQKNLDELNQYYRITKLENDNTAILLKMIQDQDKTIQDQAKSIEALSKRVGVLENGKKSA